MSESKQLRATAASLPPEAASKKVKQNNFGKTIDVYCRFRPISAQEKRSPYYIIDCQAGSVELDAPDEIIQKNSKIKKYTFTQVFGESASQEEVFGCTVKTMVNELLSARGSGVIFSYGVTNAGKTHTIIGNKTDPGLLPRLLSYLMVVKEAILKGEEVVEFHDTETPIDLEVGFESFEIYNEEIFDLNPDSKKADKGKVVERPKLKVKEGPHGTLIIEELQNCSIKNEEEAVAIVQKCLKNRQVAATSLNANSSRSHTIFRVTVDLVTEFPDKSKTATKRLGHLCVVDLAGSERAKRTENVEGKLKEAGGINNSLMVLGRCFQALKNNSIVPYRDCKLTRLLSEFFKYESRIKMITNINPREEDFTESLRVLNYASLAKEVKFIASSFKSIRMESNMKPKVNQTANNGRHSNNPMDVEVSECGDRRDGGFSARGCIARPTAFDLESTYRGLNPWDDRDGVDKFVQKMQGIFKGLLEEHKAYTEKIFRQIRNETLKAILTQKIRLEQKRPFPSAGSTPSKFTKTEWHFEVAPNQAVFEAPVTSNQVAAPSRSTEPLPSTRRRTRGPKSDLKKSNSDDEENFKRMPVIKINQSKHAKQSCYEVTATPEQKLQRSSFYDSLLKQPRMKEESLLEISRREHIKMQKDKYLFLLEVCDNDFNEADKWYRSEFDLTPPKLTSKERQALLTSNN